MRLRSSGENCVNQKAILIPGGPNALINRVINGVRLVLRCRCLMGMKPDEEAQRGKAFSLNRIYAVYLSVAIKS